MKLIPVVINGKIHRLSERAMEILNLEKIQRKDTPIELQKLPPDLTILKIQKKEVVPEAVQEVKEVQPVEVKKKEDVTAESTVKNKPKRNGRKVGVKK